MPKPKQTHRSTPCATFDATQLAVHMTCAVVDVVLTLQDQNCQTTSTRSLEETRSAFRGGNDPSLTQAGQPEIGRLGSASSYLRQQR